MTHNVTNRTLRRLRKIWYNRNRNKNTEKNIFVYNNYEIFCRSTIKDREKSEKPEKKTKR